MLGISLAHNAMTGAPEVEEVAVELWEELQKELSADVFAQAKARGEAIDLQTAFTTLPQELTS